MPRGTRVQIHTPVEAVHKLPVFQHVPEPLVAPELFRPVLHKRLLPQGLTALLIPSADQYQPREKLPVGPVDVWCGEKQVSVRVDRLQLRHWTTPSLFRLGSCPVSGVSPRYLYFHHRLTECSGHPKVVGGQLVYTHSLQYVAPPQGSIVRVPVLNLAISCHYNRFFYSYRVGFQPQTQPPTFLKSIRNKHSFSLTVCNGQWEPLPPAHWFVLGEPVYFSAQAVGLLAGERLYVDSCHVTSSEESDRTPTVDIISNYGCMTDSQRAGSGSHFVARGASELRFSVDSFLLKTVPQLLYLHCSMSVGLEPSHLSKSCNYNKAVGRWEELEAPPPVCSCCSSVCTDTHHPVRFTVSSAGWHIGQIHDPLNTRALVFQAEESEVTGRQKMAQWLETSGQTKLICDEEAQDPQNTKPCVLPANRKHWRSQTPLGYKPREEEDQSVIISLIHENSTSAHASNHTGNVSASVTSPKFEVK